MGLEDLPTETIEMLAGTVMNFGELRNQWFLQSLGAWMSDGDSSEFQ